MPPCDEDDEDEDDDDDMTPRERCDGVPAKGDDARRDPASERPPHSSLSSDEAAEVPRKLPRR